MAITRAQLNSNMANTLTALVDIPDHLAVNHMMLDYMEQQIGGITDGTWSLDKANYYNKNQIDVLFNAKTLTAGNGVSISTGNTINLGGILTEETTFNADENLFQINHGPDNIAQFASDYIYLQRSIDDTYNESSYFTLEPSVFDINANGLLGYSELLAAQDSGSSVYLQNVRYQGTVEAPNKQLYNATAVSLNGTTAALSSLFLNNTNFTGYGFTLSLLPTEFSVKYNPNTSNSSSVQVGMSMDNTGALTLNAFAGSGNRMVVADATGKLTTQAVPSNGTTLPSQTGNTGKYLTTDGSNLSWGSINIATPTNRVAFGNASGTGLTSNANLTFDGNSLTVAGNGNTTTPTLVLKNIQSTSYASVDVIGGSGITSTTKFQFGQYATGDAFFFLNGNNNLDYYTNSSNRMRITGGGNVLVGTTTDAGQKFQVNGTTSLNGATTIGSTLTINATAGGGNPTSIGYFETYATNTAYLTVSNSENQFGAAGVKFKTGGTERFMMYASSGTGSKDFTISNLQSGVTGNPFTISGSTNTVGISTLAVTSGATFTSLAGTGTRMVVANSVGLLSTQAIPAYTAGNGLTLSGSTLKLGGTLTEATTIAGGNYAFTMSNLNSFTATSGTSYPKFNIAGNSSYTSNKSLNSSNTWAAVETLNGSSPQAYMIAKNLFNNNQIVVSPDSIDISPSNDTIPVYWRNMQMGSIYNKIMTWDNIGNTIGWIDATSLPSSNFANTDLSLNANRTHDLNGFNLAFIGTSKLMFGHNTSTSNYYKTQISNGLIVTGADGAYFNLDNTAGFDVNYSGTGSYYQFYKNQFTFITYSGTADASKFYGGGGSTMFTYENSGAGGTKSYVLADNTGVHLKANNTGVYADSKGLHVSPQGNVTVDKTITTAGVTSSKAVEVTDSVEGVILKSPNGNRWRLTVNDSGALTTTLI